MNSRQNNNKSIAIVICTILVLLNLIRAQDVPVPANHLVHNYIDRHIALGNISQDGTSIRPYTYSYVRNVLHDLSMVEQNLSVKDIKLLRRFEVEFSVETFSDKVEFPLSKKNIKYIGKTFVNDFESQNLEPHILSYRNSDLFAWADLSERVTLETIDESIYKRYTDEFSIYGSIADELSFFVGFTMNRFVGDSTLVYQIEGYKNEDNPYFDFVNWTLWYQSNAAFTISTKYGDFQLSKTPVIWGFSPEHSPILSGATQTFPFINYSFKNKFVGFNFLHGSLLPYRSTTIHKLAEYPQKYIAGQRIEFYLSNNFSFSFNELVVYGNRPFELEYLIPVNFLWPAEHNQGDKDNLLMALDCSWRIMPGLRWYNTLFWDELAWEKIFSKWWGNKYVFQSGVHWVSKTSPILLEARIEGTIARPWTYTHEDDINSYSSAEIGLGLPQGPNSQSLLIQIGMWPSYRWNVVFETMLMKKGIELGSSVLDNYNDRNRDLDLNTPFLLGQIQNSAELKVKTSYAVSRLLNIAGWVEMDFPGSNINGYLGLTVDW